MKLVKLSVVAILVLWLGLANIYAKGRVDKRQQKQKARIKQGVRNGSLTKKEARKLKKEQRNIKKKVKRMKADGELTDKEKAKLEGLFILTRPHLSVDVTSEIEAIIQGLDRSEDLKLEFWVKTPRGVSEELANIDVKKLDAGEEAQYSANVKFNEKGHHTVYAYLYDKDKRIGYKSDTVLVR